MNNIKRQFFTQRLLGLATATAIMLPLSAGFAGTAQAAECSPLQVNRFHIVDAKPVRQGSSIVGANFIVKTRLFNTNRSRPHSGNNADQAVLRVKVAPHSQSLGLQDLGLQKYPRGVAAGGSLVFNSKRVTVMRDPGNLTNFYAEVEAYVYNAACDPGKQIAHSVFKFDLNPVLRGLNPKRVSARIRVYSERAAPPPRGTGAPRPRS